MNIHTGGRGPLDVEVSALLESASALPEPGGPSVPAGSTVVATGNPSGSYATPYLQPGLTVLVALAPPFFLGADVNALVLASLPEAAGTSNGSAPFVALTAHAQLGARF